MSPASTPLGGLTTAVPIVMLPVRLETHFVRVGTATQLLVRIYPDDVHVDSHEPRLTSAEQQAGRHFWTQTWLAGDDIARMTAAWRQLVVQVGAPRAAYIADTLTPTNATARPAKPDKMVTPPAFAALTARPAGWARAAYARALPDYWTAIGYAGGQRFTFTGAVIPRPLALTPTLDTTAGGTDAENIRNDPNAGWLVDFKAAEDVGMALRIPYPVPFETPLDRLLVLGVKSSITPAAGEELLQSLLRGHRYAGGLGFAAQGTPTNNTDSAGSGYSAAEAGYLPASLADPVDVAFVAGNGSNRDVASRALGVDPVVFGAIEHAAAPEQREAYHMNVAAWPATWGYFLEQVMAGPGSPSPAAIRSGREHFSSYVRARGPLPAVRIGRQPYGLLPAISLDGWKPLEGGAIDAPMVRAVSSLRAVWRTALDGVPRIPFRADAAAELERILEMQPTSGRFSAQPMQPIAPLGATQPGRPMGSSAARTLAQALGITWNPRVLRTLFGRHQREFDLTGALLQAALPEPRSETDTLGANYLRSLLAATWTEIRDEVIATKADALLYVLLRHSALLQYTSASFRVLLRRGLMTADALVEPDIANAARTPWTQLATAVPGLTPAAVGAYLDRAKSQLLRDGAAQDVAAAGAIWRRNLYEVAATGDVPADLAEDLREFGAFVRSVDYLASRPTAALARLLAETLDLASNRLDAWATSFATKRLEWMRQRTPRGAAIGGYGYVERVSANTRTPIPPPDVPAGEIAPELAAPLYASSDNFGYVQTPALAHATTAAILRSGYLSRRASGDGPVLAVNLDSQRVRVALSLLDGIRQGQSLSALLGYRFERGLHENHGTLLLDLHVPAFRTLSPLPGEKVVDGLALLQRYRDAHLTNPPTWSAATIPFGSIVPPVALPLPMAVSGNKEFEAMDAELRGLDAAIDALRDLSVAEAVHQVAQGNPVRAGAVLEAIAVGEAPSPELEIVRTPRTGVAVTHRLVILFSNVPAAAGWTSGTPRSAAEPFLEAWCQQLLGPGAADARCRVAYVDRATGAAFVDGAGQPYRSDVTLRQLALGALDIVYGAESRSEAQASEIEQRLACVALQASPGGVRPAGVPDMAGVRITFDRPSDWPPATRAAAEVLEIARTVRTLITSARALAPSDLELPDADVLDGAYADVAPPGEPVSSLERPLRLPFRADAAVAAFRAARIALIDAIPLGEGDTIAPDVARPLLLRAAAFGIPGAVPISPGGNDAVSRQTLHTQALSVVREMSERVARLDALAGQYNAARATAVETRDYHAARLAEVFGAEFRALPRFSAVSATTLGQSFAASITLQNNDPLEVMTWLQRAARVRQGAARLDVALTYAEAVGGAAGNLVVGQLPFNGAADRWVGLAPPVSAPTGGRISLVTQAPVPINTTRPLAGLLVDDWLEVVPNAEETTGLALHFNRPNSVAPQTILLAVPPDERTTWDVETLEATVLETLELAKLRLVDPSGIAEVRQFLPAIYFAQPASVQTVTTDLTRLEADGAGA